MCSDHFFLSKRGAVGRTFVAGFALPTHVAAACNFAVKGARETITVLAALILACN